MSLVALARNTGYAFGENRLTLAAVIILALLALCAIFGPSVAPFDPLTTSATTKLAPPSALHLFGTDALGRDIYLLCDGRTQFKSIALAIRAENSECTERQLLLFFQQLSKRGLIEWRIRT